MKYEIPTAATVNITKLIKFLDLIDSALSEIKILLVKLSLKN